MLRVSGKLRHVAKPQTHLSTNATVTSVYKARKSIARAARSGAITQVEPALRFKPGRKSVHCSSRARRRARDTERDSLRCVLAPELMK